MSDETTITNESERRLLEAVPDILRRMQMQSTSLSRSMLAGRLGTQFSGERDLYQTFGYILNPNWQDYKDLFDRQGLAGRAVRKFADDTFNAPAVIIDGDVRSDNTEEGSTEFIDAWNKLEKRIAPWSMMRQADIMCGFSRYSIIFIGTPADRFADPAGEIPPDSVFYLQAFHEGSASIASYVRDMKSRDFGLPATYQVDFSGEDGELIELPGGNLVHHSRVIHIAEEKLGSRVFGTPRLQNIINRLFDIEKTVGGGAEAAWLSVFQGMLFLARDGAQLPAAGTAEADALDETINKFMHRIQRYAALEGVDVQNLGVSTVDVRGIFEVETDDLCGSLGIPKRIFFGSERGELASSQDKREWNGVIDSRRTNHAEPNIARPFINWMIQHGVIPPPESGKYDIEWKEVYPMTKSEKADYALVLANGASTVTNGNPEEALDVNEWRVANDFPPRSEEELADFQEEADKEKQEGLALEKAKAIAAGGENEKYPEDSEEQDNPFQNSLTLGAVKLQGGAGSGHHDHAGRPGKRGGSLPAGESGGSESGESVVVYQGRPKKDDSLENKEGLIWGSSARAAAETHAGIEDVYYPYREEGKRHEKIYHGEIRKVKLTYENPLVVDHSKTLWDRDREAKVIEEAKESGYDAVIFEYKSGKKDYVVWDKSQASIESVDKNSLHLQGGAGSGNFDHAGRPGKRGGSAPRSGGSGSVDYGRDPSLSVGDRADEVVSQIADVFDFDKKKILYYETAGEEFTVGGKTYTKAAAYYPESGEVAFWKAGRRSESELEGIAAHEFTHDKWHGFVRTFEEQSGIIQKQMRETDNSKDWLIKMDGSFRDPSNATKFWAYETNRLYLQGDNYHKLKELDGVTPYSKSYWDEVAGKDIIPMTKVHRAINETLAEITRLNIREMDKSHVDPLWLDFHKRIMSNA